MPQLSKFRLNEKVWQKVWQRFAVALSSVDEHKRMEVLIGGLLTPTEEVMLAKRLMVGILSLSGWNPHAIATALKMSPSTVYKLKEYAGLNKEYQTLLKELFPEKIVYKKAKGKDEVKDKKNSLLELLEDIMVGYRHRSRLYYGEVPKGE